LTKFNQEGGGGEDKETWEGMQMTGIISRCIICGQFFDSKKGLREHKDKHHRIPGSKIIR
jgi:hypothetical protein